METKSNQPAEGAQTLTWPRYILFKLRQLSDYWRPDVPWVAEPEVGSAFSLERLQAATEEQIVFSPDVSPELILAVRWTAERELNPALKSELYFFAMFCDLLLEKKQSVNVLAWSQREIAQEWDQIFAWLIPDSNHPEEDVFTQMCILSALLLWERELSLAEGDLIEAKKRVRRWFGEAALLSSNAKSFLNHGFDLLRRKYGL
jgi:hypothetical protein